MRKLVTHRLISDIKEHTNADALELAVIDGWQVVVKKGEFQKGDSCCYFEIDSFLPADDPRFEFLKKTGIKKDESGQERIRLRTVKLRKELSQGLALPWSSFPEFHERDDLDDIDMAEVINVIKYERPEPKVTNAAGYFPEIIPKTDEERVQNIWDHLKEDHKDDLFVPTLKLDGSSCTVALLTDNYSSYWKNDDIDDSNALDIHVYDSEEKKAEIIVCSRNLQLKVDENSHFWKAATSGHPAKPSPISALMDHAYLGGRSIAIQGEVLGFGIQGNKEKLNDYQFYVFNVFCIEGQRYYDWFEVIDFCNDHGLKYTPQLDEPRKPFSEFTLDELLAYSDGPSLNNKRREGIVWKMLNDGNKSMKVISNQWLLAGNDD